MTIPFGYKFAMGVGYMADDGSGPYSIDRLGNVSLIGGSDGLGPLIVGAGFAVPAGAKTYVSGDLIADSTVAATVNANVTASAGIMIIAASRVVDRGGMLRRVRLKTDDTVFAGKNVRVHFYKNRPTVTNGDDGVFATNEQDHLDYCDVLLNRHFSDFEKGIGVPSVGGEINFLPSLGTVNIFALIECRDIVAGTASKNWALACEVLQS